MKRKLQGSILVWLASFVAPFDPAARASDPMLDPRLVIERFDVFTDGDALLVPVSLDEKSCRFLLDTGASHTLYDKSLRSHMGERQSSGFADTASGRVWIEAFRSPEAFVGKLGLKSPGFVYCHDLEPMRQVLGREISGVIGMDVLRNHIMQLDSDSGKLLFLKGVPPSAGISVPINYDDRGLPRVVANFPDLGPQDFHVDTGAFGAGSSGSLHNDRLDSLLDRGTARKVKKGLYRDLGGDHVIWDIAVSDIELGPFHHKQLVFQGLSGPLSNTLGLRLWERYNVTFDFPNHMMYLKPSKKFDAPESFDLSGLHVLRIGGRVVIERIDEGSPAAKAGLREKDVALKIDGEDAAEMRLHTFRRRLCDGDKTVRLTVRRGEQTLELPIVLPHADAYEDARGTTDQEPIESAPRNREPSRAKARNES